MDQFSRATGGAFGEVNLLKERDAMAAGCSVEGGPEAGGTTADDDDVEGSIIGVDTVERGGTFHGYL